MEFHKVDHRYVLRINRGEEITDVITQFIKENNITAGTISGIGAASEVVLRYYSMIDKQYHDKTFTGEFEIASMTGNIALLDGELWPHIHIVLGDTNYQCFGGHLHTGIVGVTCEVVIEAMDANVVREFDEETGLKLCRFPG